MRAILAIVLVAILSACGEPKVDTSTEESMKSSMEEIKARMSPEERDEFEKAAQFILMSDVDLGALMKAALRGEELDSDEMVSDMKNRLDGLTATEIMAEAQRIRSDRKTRQDEEMRSEISELEMQLAELLEDKRQAEVISDQLKSVIVNKTRLFWQELGKYSISRKLSLELTVTNNLDIPISRLYMTGTLATPGRSVPWLVEDFNYNIAGGLEPGESQSWSLAPNEYSGGWRNAPRDRNDTVFTVSVRNVNGPDGTKLFDIEYDQSAFEKSSSRLEKLRVTLAENR